MSDDWQAFSQMQLVKYLLAKGVDGTVVSEEHGSALQVAAGVLRNGSPRPGFGAYRNEELTTYLWKRAEDLVRIVGDKKQARQSSTTCELILHRFCDTKIHRDPVQSSVLSFR